MAAAKRNDMPSPAANGSSNGVIPPVPPVPPVPPLLSPPPVSVNFTRAQLQQDAQVVFDLICHDLDDMDEATFFIILKDMAHLDPVIHQDIRKEEQHINRLMKRVQSTVATSDENKRSQRKTRLTVSNITGRLTSLIGLYLGWNHEYFLPLLEPNPAVDDKNLCSVAIELFEEVWKIVFGKDDNCPLAEIVERYRGYRGRLQDPR